MSTQEMQAREKQQLEERQDSQGRAARYYVPSIDVCEDEEALWLFADMPGVAQTDAKVEVNDNLLSIEGRVSLDEYENLSPVATEYNVGNYYRRFALPSASRYDREKVSARIRNGVLEICIPKGEASRPRRVEVTGG